MPPPADYYLDKLVHMFRWVERHHDHLLDAAARRDLQRWWALPIGARRLQVRLLQRRGPTFRLDALDYAEVEDAPLASLALVYGGFARFHDSVPERLRALTVPELRARARAWGAAPGGDRSQLLAQLLPLAPAHRHALPLLVELRARDFIDLMRLLYFGSLSADLTEFILADLGTLRWPQVRLDPVLPFRDAADARRTLHAHRAADVIRDVCAGPGAKPEPAVLEVLEACARPLYAPTDCPRLAERRARALGRLAECWQRHGHPRRALRLFRLADAGPARERICRLLAGHGRRAAARRVLAQISAEPRDAQEASFARRFDVHRGRCRPRRRGATRWVQRRLLLPRGALSGMPRGAAPLRVEQRVCRLLALRGNRALHLENALPGMLFALGFWDIIYAPLPGAFVQPFQDGPVDLHDGRFRTRRAAAIAERLAAISAERFGVRHFLRRARACRGHVNAFWHGRPTAEGDLEAILRSLPPAVRAGICDIVASDPMRARRGFPDLTIANDVVGCYGFIEVKGPGDALRESQRQWLSDLVMLGAPAQVLEVRYA